MFTSFDPWTTSRRRDLGAEGVDAIVVVRARLAFTARVVARTVTGRALASSLER